jgi:asparagine synthase (glutamine-hydrolysing)
MANAFTVVWDGHEGVEIRLPRTGPVIGSSCSRPSRDRWTETTAVVVGDLFYRDDLCARMSFPLRDRAEVTDAELAIEAYHRRGCAGLAEMEGEFALILWDGATRRLLALRDPLGSWPLFWTTVGSAISVSSSLETLVDAQPSRKSDWDYLAEFLMWPNPHAELPCERTAFMNVSRIRAGTMMEWSAGGRVERRRYWDWPARFRTSPKITDEEAGHEVAKLFRDAVRERLRRAPAAAHLSGGMDSSAVVCVARDLAAQDRGTPLLTLSLVYPKSGLAAEAGYMEMVLEQTRGLEPRFVDGETVPDYEWFGRGLPRHDEPFAGLPGAGADVPLLEEAGRAGATTVLTGLGSDELFASSPIGIADLLQQRRWLAAIREARRWAQAENRGTWSVLRRYGLEQSWPRWWGDPGTWPRLGWFAIPPWVTPSFAREHHMAERGLRHARRLTGAPVSNVLEKNFLDAAAGDWVRWHLAAPRGLRLSHPFQDPRLMCFALGLPARVRSVPGRRKPVLETAMRGVLPEGIRTRRDKRGFDDIYGLGLVRNLARLEHLVQNSALRQCGVLEVDPLIRAMRDAAMGIGDIRARERMDKTLALVAWFEEAAQRPKPSGASCNSGAGNNRRQPQ